MGALSAQTQPPERVLLIRPSALGDVVRTTPVLSSLHKAWPRARIDWLVQEGFEDAVRYHPGLGGVVRFPRGAIQAWGTGKSHESLLAFVDELKRPRYDMVIDCQGLLRSGLMAWGTGAKRRVGDRRAREWAWLFYTQRVRVDQSMHTVERMLALVEALGVTPRRDADAQRVFCSEEARRWVERDVLTGPRDRLVVLAPTSRWPGKQWPADRFAAVARALLARGCRVAVVGSGSERGQVGPLLELAGSEAGVLDLVGGTSIDRLLAMIERCALLIGNDSAAVHMAVALGRPLVALYGPTRVDRVGPYRREADVLQRVGAGDRLDHKDEASGRALMERIGVDEVVSAALARL